MNGSSGGAQTDRDGSWWEEKTFLKIAIGRGVVGWFDVRQYFLDISGAHSPALG